MPYFSAHLILEREVYSLEVISIQSNLSNRQELTKLDQKISKTGNKRSFMSIVIINKKRSIEKINNEFDFPLIIDVTSKSKDKFLPLSPFYPHGDIPVPFSSGYNSKSVEGIWQGLKVFKTHDIDTSKFEIDSMKGLKRTAKKFGQPIGHRKGVTGTELFDYLEARKHIYIPSYEWMLKNKCSNLVKELYDLSKNNLLILLDYETNDDLYNLKRPLSHAALVKQFVENGLR